MIDDIETFDFVTSKILEDIIRDAEEEATLVLSNRILPKGYFQMSKDRFKANLPCLKVGDGIRRYSELPFIESN